LTPVERRRRTVAGAAFLIGLVALVVTIAPALGGGSGASAGKPDAKALPDAKEIVAREQRQKRIDARRDRAAAKRRKKANAEWRAIKKQADVLKSGATTDANSPAPSQSTPSTPQQQAPATPAAPTQQAPATTTPAAPSSPAPAGTNDPRYYRGE
jgi:hypothetical protein